MFFLKVDVDHRIKFLGFSMSAKNYAKVRADFECPKSGNKSFLKTFVCQIVDVKLAILYVYL